MSFLDVLGVVDVFSQAIQLKKAMGRGCPMLGVVEIEPHLRRVPGRAGSVAGWVLVVDRDGGEATRSESAGQGCSMLQESRKAAVGVRSVGWVLGLLNECCVAHPNFPKRPSPSPPWGYEDRWTLRVVSKRGYYSRGSDVIEGWDRETRVTRDDPFVAQDVRRELEGGEGLALGFQAGGRLRWAPAALPNAELENTPIYQLWGGTEFCNHTVMSRSRQNNIRGPTSALTEFLRESGITPTTIARRAAQQQPQQDEQAQAGPSTETQQNEAGPSSSRPSRTASRNRRASGYGSDNLDEDDGEPEPEQDGDDEKAEELEESPAPAKKRKLTKAAEAKLKAQEKKKKGKGKKGSDDEDYEDDDPYTSLSKSMWSSGSSKPPVGSFENCARCEKQFTVTKYTMAANPPPGWLCHVCAKASGQDPFKKPAAPRKRKAPGDKREVIHFVENRLPSLVNMCIKIVTQYIDDVESLGDIGALNVEAIAKAMAKNRSLTPENARLFYTRRTPSSYSTTRRVYLTSSALESLVYMNPNLTSLRLDFCGQLDDKSFKLFITSLPALQRIELLGPFLVRAPSWKAFARAHPNLEGFLINQSPRFDLECMHALVTYCRGLKALRLREIGKMSDAFLEEIGDLGPEALTYLDLSCPSESCSDTAIRGRELPNGGKKVKKSRKLHVGQSGAGAAIYGGYFYDRDSYETWHREEGLCQILHLHTTYSTSSFRSLEAMCTNPTVHAVVLSAILVWLPSLSFKVAARGSGKPHVHAFKLCRFQSRELDPLLFHQRSRGNLHTPNIELVGYLPSVGDSSGRTLACSRDFDPLLFDQRGTVPQRFSPTQLGTPYILTEFYHAFISQQVARGKDFCCVFVIRGALTLCNDRIVRRRQFHRACVNYFQTKVPSPHRHPAHRIHFCRVFTIRGALTYFGHKAASWIHAGDSIVIQAQIWHKVIIAPEPTRGDVPPSASGPF
ncbi:hypothetical protein DFP72DRAFT_1106852 [Ephemerocybe angulata]|uniref:DNA repair protein rhp7 treble clef domain-containing protein n=1 Tax=Ephemerocybe angulata TaxID=980116 RepID=A0A8H6I5L7_9AGAR|nr:hypothetical protein DFP72DRAFT_1106852 [Tulosesus angulatus]